VRSTVEDEIVERNLQLDTSIGVCLDMLDHIQNEFQAILYGEIYCDDRR